MRHKGRLPFIRHNFLTGRKRPNYSQDADGKSLLHLPTQYLRDAERRSLKLRQTTLISEWALRRRWIGTIHQKRIHERRWALWTTLV